MISEPLDMILVAVGVRGQEGAPPHRAGHHGEGALHLCPPAALSLPPTSLATALSCLDSHRRVPAGAVQEGTDRFLLSHS